MLCALLIVLLAVQEATPVVPSSPVETLLVEIVDPVWATMPGVTVTVIPRANRKQRYSATTDKDGIARFFVPKLAEYEIEAVLTGFKKGRLKSVWLASGLISESNGKVRQAAPPRVQIRLAVSRAS